MEYRRLGKSGLKLSTISLGSWLTYGTVVEQEQAAACVKKAYDLGINHFDCAVAYGSQPHEAERLLGALLKPFPRHTYTVTSKVFWKIGPSTYDQGLSRKHLFDRVDMSLAATGLDYIDIYYCHRFDPETDVEETLRALDDLVALGKIRYYGFSEWSAAQIENALAIVDKRNLRHPVVNQPAYNLLNRYIEKEVVPVSTRAGIGQVVFSPLAQGLLTGKYKPGQPAPAGTRGADAEKTGRFLQKSLADDALLAKIQNLQPVAERNGLSLGQLALAWTLQNPGVTSAIIGATRPEQVEENVRAAGVKLSAADLTEIDQILA